MSRDLGKKFEDSFKKQWADTFPGTFLYRLPDQMNGYKESSENPADFFCFPVEACFLVVECKSHKGASIPFNAIPQYERLLEYKGRKNTYPGVLVWFYEKDKILWVSIEEAEKMVLDGEKSIGLRMLDQDYKNKYNILDIPATKLRVFMKPDYEWLVEALLKEG